MLSARAVETAAQLDVPWRFVPQGDPYDAQTNPDGVVSFATAENTLVAQDVADYISRLDIPPSALSYPYSSGGGPRLPRALASHLNEHFCPHQPLDGTEILVTAGATALHEVLAFSLGDPGDGVLLSRPNYGRFELDFWNKARLRVVWADSQPESCFRPEVVSVFDEAVREAAAAGITVRILFITNPHNPLGRCYPRETLVAIMGFCQARRIHLVSDEIYALTVFESGEPTALPFTSALSVDPAGLIDRDLLHVEYGLAKDFGAAGLRIGALVTRNRSLHRAARSIVRFHNPSGLAVAAASAMLEDRAWCRSFFATAHRRAADAYTLCTAELRRIGIAYLPGSNAGLFVWADLSPFLPPASDGRSDREREFALARKILDGGAFVHPGEEHALRPGWFRIVYTLPPDTVREGLRRLGAVVQNISWE